MIATDGRVVLTDFGIARALKESSQAEGGNEFVGTPEYMAPEQIEGLPIDARTDLYALGVMLYEMVTGALPFTGATPMRAAAARLMGPPKDPRTLRADLPPALSEVVLRSLSRKPEDRYPSASALAAALLEALPSASAAEGGSGAIGSASGQSQPRSPTAAGQSNSGPWSRNTGDPSISGSALPALFPNQQAKGVAVLPFRNQGPPEDEYLADGLTEDLIDSLSMVPGLRVRSRGAVTALLELGAEACARARELGVEVAVAGTVRRAGDALRVAARIINLADSVQLWAQRFDRPAREALEINDQVAQAVTTALTSEQQGPRRTGLSDPEILDIYLRARALMVRLDPLSIQQASTLFEQALSVRPDDPQLLSSYALARARAWFMGIEGSGPLSQSAAERAVALAPDRADSHLALAMVYGQKQDQESAVRSLREALRRAPENADAHEQLGRILVETGPLTDGIRHLEYAFSQSPALVRLAVDLARAYALSGDWTRSMQVLDDPRFTEQAMGLQWVIRIRLMAWRNDRRGIEALRRHPDFVSGRVPRANMLLQSVLGERALSAGQLFERDPNGANVSPRARIFMHQLECELSLSRGELDVAARAVARCVDAGLIDLMWLDHMPALAPLRKDRRYRDLRKIVTERVARIHAALRGP